MLGGVRPSLESRQNPERQAPERPRWGWVYGRKTPLTPDQMRLKSVARLCGLVIPTLDTKKSTTRSGEPGTV